MGKAILKRENNHKYGIIAIVMFGIFVLLLVINYFMSYTIDIRKPEEIVAIQMHEPFDSSIYRVEDREAVNEFINSINGKRLKYDGLAAGLKVANRIYFYNAEGEVVYSLTAFGENKVVMYEGAIPIMYVGDIEIRESFFTVNGRKLYKN